MQKHLEVRWWDGSVVGHLVQQGPIYFAYDQSWLDRGHDLSPISLPFTSSTVNASRGADGLPGLMADCLPDRWGRKVAERDFAANGLGAISPIKLLAWRGRRGVGALSVEPPLGVPIQPLLNRISALSLARGAKSIEQGSASAVLPQLARGGTAGGAYPKAIVLAYADGSLSVADPDGVGRPSILKFDLSANGDQAPVEYAYLEMARTGGILSASGSLIFSEESAGPRRAHLLVDRFDVDPANPARRFHFHTASGLLHRESHGLDYRDLMRIGIRLGIGPEARREICRRMIFNVLASNHDDHGRNHAFRYDEDTKKWSLTPAYDLTFNEGYLDRGMTIEGEVWPSLEKMRVLSEEGGVRKADFAEDVDRVRDALGSWSKVAKRAGVPAASIKTIQQQHERIAKSVFPSVTAPPPTSAGGREASPVKRRQRPR